MDVWMWVVLIGSVAFNVAAICAACWIMQQVANTAKLMAQLCDKCADVARTVESFERKHGGPPITLRD